MFAATPSYRTRDDVRFRVVMDEALVIRQEAAEVLVLNEVGGRILELLGEEEGGTSTPEELHRCLSREYDVDSETLRDDVDRFLEELESAGVVQRVAESFE